MNSMWGTVLLVESSDHQDRSIVAIVTTVWHTSIITVRGLGPASGTETTHTSLVSLEAC